jgi:hypothetical protein
VSDQSVVALTRPLTRAVAAMLGIAGLSPIAGAQPAPDLPPAIVAVVLDTSGSVARDQLERTVELALGVLGTLPAGSQVSVFTFDDESRRILERTSDREAIRAALLAVESSGRFTALHDALYDASRSLTETPPTRRAILLLTDGKDENSALLLEDGLAVAQQNQIPVFAVGIGNAQERELRRIAKLTGGDYTLLSAASGREIAARIVALDPGTPLEAAPEPEPPPEPSPVPPAADSRHTVLIAATALLAGVVAAVIGGIVLLRRRYTPRRQPAPPTERERPPEPVSDGELPKTLLLGSRPALEIVEGPGRGQVIGLSTQKPSTIGRSSGCDIVLEDLSISTRHCRLELGPEGWAVADLDSTNGTYLNERPVSRRSIGNGDVIRIGETSLQFRMR